MEQRGILYRRLGDDHEDQPGAIFVAVDYGRRVLNLVRDEGNGRGDGGGASVAVNANILAELQPPHGGLGDEEADFDVLGGQELNYGVAASDPFSGTIQRVKDEAIARRADLFLLQPPLGLLQGGAGGGDA